MANSPGVFTQEKDLTFQIQSITSNAGAYVGMFRWGPVNEIVSITTNESELVKRFGQPDTATTGFFHAAANYLAYSVPLMVVRVAGDLAVNSVNSGSIVANPAINNIDAYDAADLTGIAVLGRYPGDLANNIKVSIADSTGFSTWAYASEFDYAPGTGQMNVVVVDEDGGISGTAGTVLERYSLMTTTPGSKKTDGTTAYIVEAIRNQSQYIFIGDTDEIVFTTGVFEESLAGGVDDNVVANGDFDTAWDLFSNKDVVDFVRAFTSFNPTTAVISAVDNADTRQDVIVFNAPQLSDVYNNVNQVENVKTYFETTINKPSSYAFNVDNWKMVYDKYNDNNIWIPCDSDAAGLHARVFVQNEPWFSPAGLNRGQLKNVIKLAWNPNQAQRDVLYPASINSIVAFKGEGTVLFGDKTALRAPSAFSRINVRSLFIVIKKAIASAARYQLFELNDFFTQTLFRTASDRYLDDVKGRRGIIDKRVVCDSTNNTPQVIDSNGFVGDIYVKPSKSINFIQLNFTAVATGVSFEEIEGA
jgi:hypothetical protein